MAKIRVRAVTLHVIIDDWLNPGYINRVVTEATEIVSEAAEAIEREAGVEVWTKRVAFPPVRGRIGEVVSILEKTRYYDGIYYSVLHADSLSITPSHIERVISAGDRVYASVYTDRADETTAQLLYSIASLQSSIAYRFSVTVPDHVETPYFPSATTTSSVPGLSIALLYASLFREKDRAEANAELLGTLDRIEDAVTDILRRRGLQFYGFDLSLSPWMDDSVVELVEKISGVPLGEIGTGSAILELEEMIARTCDETICTGFNQVMLPVAEDNILKNRVREGRISLKDLALLNYACVAGIDMVVIPSREWSPQLAQSILREVLSASSAKGMPLGVRILTAEGRPGEDVDLGVFGLTPIIRIS